MKTRLTLLLLLAATVLSANNRWEDPTIVNKGVESPRATAYPFTSVKDMEEGNKWNSPYIYSLNGKWDFRFAYNVAERTPSFYELSFDAWNWGEIKVPSSWEREGFGTPVYTNINYIFPKNPPFVDNNDLPIGSYRKWFTLPAGWDGREVFLCFESISGAATVWLNGKEIAYSKVSKMPAEINITPYLREGNNLLAVEVFKWSDASYIEDQDFWRLAGIDRDVYLLARPKVSVEDFFAIGDLDAAYRNGILSFDYAVRNFDAEAAAGYTLNVTLYDENSKKITERAVKLPAVAAGGITRGSFKENISKPKQWSAEFPNLYTLAVVLKNGKGEEVELTGCKTGFRKVEIKNGNLLVNGAKVYIKGVNLHEYHPVTGRVVDRATYIKDITLMKRNNINAIRTSHYPQNVELYKLCNRYGLYVIDEVNLETHALDGFDQSRHPSFMPEWKAQLLDRTERMVERDKNNPCIIGWSCGNESDFGPNYEATYNWMKQRDKTRTVQFERAFENPFTDIVVPMYATIDQIKQYSENSDNNRPLILCEYAHAMGNSTGNLQEYWDAIYGSRLLQGGFIWEWVEHGLLTKDEQGRDYYAYGGDLGGHRWTHDENFVADGLVSACREPNPGLNEVRKVYQPIYFKASDLAAGKIELTNLNQFTDLDAYNYRWTVSKNGQFFAEGEFVASGKPNAVVPVQFNLPRMEKEEGIEYFLTVRALAKNATPMIPAGYVIASEQFLLPESDYFVARYNPSGSLVIKEEDNKIVFASGAVKGTIDLKTGLLNNYSSGDKNLLRVPLAPNFWRAATDNDYGELYHIKANSWRAAAENRIFVSSEVVEKSANKLVVKATYKLNDVDSDYTLRYTVYADGAIAITSDIRMGEKTFRDMPRFGIKLELPIEYDSVAYYGRGPWENYVDRCRSAFVGNYKGVVDDMKYEYTRPQENGYRTDVRSLILTDDEGEGFRIDAEEVPFCFNVRRNTDHDLDAGLTKKQQHTIDIDPRSGTLLNIDLAQRGVAGDNAWGAQPMEKYRLLDNHYTHTFRISPVGK